MIRNFKSSDIPAITDIFNHFILHSTAIFDLEPMTEKEVERKMESIAGTFPCLVYEEEGELAGFCYAHPWKEKKAYSRTLETTIYLKPGFDGKGIGKSLMNMLTDECARQGYSVLIACITAENEGSIRFHEKLGFRKVSHFEKVGEKFGRQLDVVDMELML